MRKLLLLVLLGLVYGEIYGQDARARLEAQRKQLQQEIVQINGMLQKNKTQKADALESLEDLFLKIDRLRELIRLTNRQINALTSQINKNQADISALEEELAILKEDYASMIVKSRKNSSQQNRLMFLFSSENFWQVIKRVRYMNQYAAYRKQQGENIAKKTKTLRQLNENLVSQKAVKEELLSDNRKVQEQFEQERKKQQNVLQNLRSIESKYAAQIKKKQRQTVKIDREIDRLIREAIAASNKKAGTTNVSFALTPEAKALAANFVANKGRLPWPVRKGVVIQKFGTQRHAVVRTTTIKSNGVTIATNNGAKARAVFEGTVLNIVQFQGSNPIVLIQHGNYVTAYKNLASVSVQKGDKVVSKQEIGSIFTNPTTQRTSLQFSVFYNTTPKNPADWIFQMR
ncbi:MAG: peptidoglycan DD-metalloendopeptidase family protein [Bacteroidota bacterium]|nr:peptidoglycan DD-metalloendopeptidase family protein [Bacteroidota bacterium]